MNEKLSYLTVLGGLLVASYPLGCGIAKLQRSGRWLSVLAGLAGIVLFFIGNFAADEDHRYRLLAALGICLQVAGFVGSARSRNQPRHRSLDLWAPSKLP